MIIIDIISAVPELFGNFFERSILGRAQKKGLVEIKIHDLRDFAINKHGQIDDYPFGGGPGMVLRIEPIHDCINSIRNSGRKGPVIFLSPDGDQFDQATANELAGTNDHMILLCGHYKGIDERIRENLVDREISLGDYVISGGELGAAIIADAVVRLIPGAIGDSTSALTDSFQDGLVAPPVYTRPAQYGDWDVPEILPSGDEKKINEWKEKQAQSRTEKKRPDKLK